MTHWFLDGKPISSRLGTKTSLSNRRLTLSNPTAFRSLEPVTISLKVNSYNFQGEHYLLCKVSAESGRLFEQKSIKLIVTTPPEVLLLPENVQRAVGSSFLADCTTKDKNVPHKSVWYKSGKKVGRFLFAIAH